MSVFETSAIYLDGETGQPLRLRLRVDTERGALVGPGVFWPLDDVREVPDIAAIPKSAPIFPGAATPAPSRTASG